VLLDTDLGWWANLAYERAFRRRVVAALGLPEERLLSCVTHTHSAPPLCEPEPQWPGGELLSAYLERLEQAMVATARAAIAACDPATIEWHHGRSALAANRDLPDPAAGPRVVCGYNPANPADDTLAAIRHTVDLPLKDWPSAAVLAAEFAACTDRPIAERLRRKLRISEALGDGATFPLEIWGWRIGDALVLGTLAEAYSSIQQNVRAAFPDRAVTWLNLVNGSIGYLPPAPLYDVEIYQAWQTPFDRGSLETLEAAAIALGHELLAS